MSDRHDQRIVTHLRSALDEVVATPDAPGVTVLRPRLRPERTKWIAVAAASLVVIGAITAAIVFNRDDTPSMTAGGTTTSTTLPAATGRTMPYFLAAADLAPGPVQTTSATPADGTLLMAWVRNGDMADGLLVMNAAALDPNLPTTSSAETSSRVIDGTRLLFDSYGLTAAEREALVAQVIPGSGLPWLLPVEGWTMAAMQTPADGPTRWQIFGGSVTLSVGPLVIVDLSQLTAASVITKVTVAGQSGWQAAADSGKTVVLWRDPVSGQWASLIIPADMSDRVDALILAVTTNMSATPLAVGQLAPATQLGRLDDVGATTNIPGPFLLVFANPSLPMADAVLAPLVAATAKGALANVTTGSTPLLMLVVEPPAESADTAAWLQQSGWGSLMWVDTDGATGAAYRVPAQPYYVLVGADGRIAALHEGVLDAAGLATLLATLR